MRQSFAWWSFTFGLPDADQHRLLAAAVEVGLEGVEMVPEERWGAVRDSGLDLVTLTGHDIERGFNDPVHHPALQDQVGAAVQLAAAHRIPFVIVFAGNRAAAGDDEAIDHCVAGLGPLAATAERTGVTLLLELLNSKVDHPGYQCDRSGWAFEVVGRVGSPALRVLFDLYHAQVMEGDLSRTVKANLGAIGHLHTAGVPGRRDLDDRQEVNWRAIAGLLRHLGYDGWVGHELIPRSDAVTALRQAHDLFADPSHAGVRG